MKFKSENSEAVFYDFVALVLYILIFFKKRVLSMGMHDFIAKIVDNRISFVFGLAAASEASVVVKLLSYIPGINNSINDFLSMSASYINGDNAVFLFINIILLTPIVEEHIFRESIQRLMIKNISVMKSVIIVSLLFGVLHMNHILWMFLAFVFSILLCKAYNKNGYFGSLSMHVGYNSLTIINYIINYFLNKLLIGKEIVTLVIYGLYLICGVIIIKNNYQNCIVETK